MQLLFQSSFGILLLLLQLSLAFGKELAPHIRSSSVPVWDRPCSRFLGREVELGRYNSGSLQGEEDDVMWLSLVAMSILPKYYSVSILLVLAGSLELDGLR